MTNKERAEKRIDNIFRKRRNALEGWLEIKNHQGHLDAPDIQCMEWEEEGFSRELKRAFELREACS